MNLSPQALFPNPKVEMYEDMYMYTHIYCTLFQRINVRLSAIYFGIYHSFNAFISKLGYSKICKRNFK
jgi:hypothetical protein